MARLLLALTLTMYLGIKKTDGQGEMFWIVLLHHKYGVRNDLGSVASISFVLLLSITQPTTEQLVEADSKVSQHYHNTTYAYSWNSWLLPQRDTLS